MSLASDLPTLASGSGWTPSPDELEEVARAPCSLGDVARRIRTVSGEDGAGRSGSADGARPVTVALRRPGSVALCSVPTQHLSRSGDPSTPCLAPSVIRSGNTPVASDLAPGTPDNRRLASSDPSPDRCTRDATDRTLRQTVMTTFPRGCPSS